MNLYSIRVCVKTVEDTLISQNIKIIVDGKIFMVHVKEITGWILDFTSEYSQMEMDVEEKIDDNLHDDDMVEENADDGLVKSVQLESWKDGMKIMTINKGVCEEVHSPRKVDENSEDPFALYLLLYRDKRSKLESSQQSDDLFFPP